jgi:di/tricarboxylate transporter
MSLYGVLVVFAGLILVVATFISHTVAALIVLPLVQQVGQGMSEPHPNLLVMGSVLMASAAMGLPTSGFPNMSKLLPSLETKIIMKLTRISCHYDGRFQDRPALS